MTATGVSRIKTALKRSPIASTAVFLIKHRAFINARQQLQIKRIAAGRAKDSESLCSFRNKHAHETCFIVGNGPSLSLDDLNRIHASRCASFGVNRISDLFDSTSWRPTYYCAMEHGFLQREDGAESISSFLSKIIDSGIEHFFLNEEHRHDFNSNESDRVSFVRCPLAPLYSTVLLPFSEDISSYVADLGSVVHFCVQIACYMGFSRIVLTGVDNTYSKYLSLDGSFRVNDSSRSHVDGLVRVADDFPAERIPRSAAEAYRLGGFADMRKTDLGYLICKEYAARHGVIILNATRGGALEVFDRVDLNTVLQGEGM